MLDVDTYRCVHERVITVCLYVCVCVGVGGSVRPLGWRKHGKGAWVGCMSSHGKHGAAAASGRLGYGDIWVYDGYTQQGWYLCRG